MGDLVFGHRPSVTQVASRVRPPCFFFFLLSLISFVILLLTMAGDEGTTDENLQDMRTRVDGLAADMKTMHELLDSTITSSTERFD